MELRGDPVDVPAVQDVEGRESQKKVTRHPEEGPLVLLFDNFIWLVVIGTFLNMTFHILGIVTPTDELHHFSEG